LNLNQFFIYFFFLNSVMRASAIVRRTKKFFSKKRVGVKRELRNIFADGVSRRKVEYDARRFQAKAMRHEANAASNAAQEKKLKLVLHNSRIGRSDKIIEVLPVVSDVKYIREQISTKRDNASILGEKARVARNEAVVRRLYSQRELKKSSRK
jgi:hypothetical protein